MNVIEDRNGELVWVPANRQEVGHHEVRLKVAATAVNRADLVQRAGHYPPPKGVTEVLGLECSGTVVEVGPEVQWPVLGQSVCALLAGGGYADEVVFPASHALPIPSGIDILQAAGLPEVFTTAWLNLKREGQLQKGERVLVHAGASGVGTAAIQLCVAWGNPVVATVGSDSKCQRVLGLGAELALNRKTGPWAKEAKANGKFDLILDPVGGSYLESNIWSLNPGGRLINIGLMGGKQGNLPLAPLLVKRLQVKGSVLRSRSNAEKADILSAMRADIWPLFDQGMIRPIIDSTFKIEEVQKAHDKVQKDFNIGKVILVTPQ